MMSMIFFFTKTATIKNITRVFISSCIDQGMSKDETINKSIKFQKNLLSDIKKQTLILAIIELIACLSIL